MAKVDPAMQISAARRLAQTRLTARDYHHAVCGPGRGTNKSFFLDAPLPSVQTLSALPISAQPVQLSSECTLVLARSLADFIGARVTAPWRTEAERVGRSSRPDQLQEALLPPPEQAALPQQSAAACPPARLRAYRPSLVSRGP